MIVVCYGGLNYFKRIPMNALFWMHQSVFCFFFVISHWMKNIIIFTNLSTANYASNNVFESIHEYDIYQKYAIDDWCSIKITKDALDFSSRQFDLMVAMHQPHWFWSKKKQIYSKRLNLFRSNSLRKDNLKLFFFSTLFSFSHACHSINDGANVKLVRIK